MPRTPSTHLAIPQRSAILRGMLVSLGVAPEQREPSRPGARRGSARGNPAEVEGVIGLTGLAQALAQEHHVIDAGIEKFASGLDRGVVETDALTSAFEALRRHIYLEEALLFPRIESAVLALPILVMQRDHGTLWRHMDTMMMQLHAADTDHAPLQKSGRDLLDHLAAHNSKEEPILYPHVDSELDDAASAELAEFLNGGHMPDGWVCQGVRQR